MRLGPPLPATFLTAIRRAHQWPGETGQAWGRASSGPGSEAQADVSPDVLPRASHAAESCQGKDKNAKPSPEPRDEGRPARQRCGVLRAVGGKRPQAGARGKCRHPTPGSFRAKEAVPPRPPSTSTPGWRKPPGPGLWTPAPSLQARRDGGFGARHSVCCEDGRIRAGRAQPSLGEPKLPSPSPWVVGGSVQLRATPGETEPRRQLSGERALTHPGSRARIGPGAAGL